MEAGAYAESSSEFVYKLRQFDIECQIDVNLSTSNQYHCFDVDLRFTIHEISMNFRCGVSLLNQWQMDEDVSIW